MPDLSSSEIPEITFLIETDRLKSVLRRTHLHDSSRLENSAEHSWQLGLAVLSMHRLADEPIDVLRALKMALIHDVVEVDAGDTFVYDEVGNADKFEREEKAAKRLYALLPQVGQELHDLWLAYEKHNCPESRFVGALDRFLPILANCQTGGLGWRTHGISLAKVLKRNAEIKEGSVRLWEQAERMIHACFQGSKMVDLA